MTKKLYDIVGPLKFNVLLSFLFIHLHTYILTYLLLSHVFYGEINNLQDFFKYFKIMIIIILDVINLLNIKPNNYL